MESLDPIKNDLSRLGSVKRFIIPAIISIGILYSYLYYNRFGINIFNYLKFQEFITAFLSAMVPIFVVLISWLLTVFINNDTTNIYTQEDFFKILLKFKSPKKRIKLYFKQFRHYFIFTLTFLVGNVIVILFSPDEMGWYLTISGMVLLALSTVIIYFENRISRVKSKPGIGNHNFMLMYTYFFFGLVMLMLAANLKVISVKENKSTYGTKIYLHNKVIVSDSLNYFIGKTEDYFFIYHEKDSYTEVYKMNDVKKIVFGYK